MNKSMAATAQQDHQPDIVSNVRITMVNDFTSDGIASLKTDPAGSVVTDDYFFAIATKLSLGVVPGVVAAEAEPHLHAGLAASAQVVKQPSLGSHSEEIIA